MTDEKSHFFFRFESEMARIVRHWMVERGCTVAEELQTPEGVADLVGCRWDEQRLGERYRQHGNLRFRSKLSSILWWSLPTQTGGVATLDWLCSICHGLASKDAIESELAWLESKGLIEAHGTFVNRPPPTWYPIQREVIAVELKLSRVSEAIRQAVRYKGFSNAVYVALPLSTAKRQSECTIHLMRSEGLGLIGVDANGVETVVDATPREVGSVHQFLIVERLLLKLKGSSASAVARRCSPVGLDRSPTECQAARFLGREPPTSLGIEPEHDLPDVVAR